MAAPRAVAPTRPGLPVALVFLVVASLLGVMARTMLVPGAEFAAVWPSAGITVLWLLVRQARAISIDTALLFGSMFGFGLLIDVPTWMAASVALCHTLQTVVIVQLMRRFVPELWGCGGTRALDSPRLLARYLASIGGGVLASAALIAVVWSVADDPDVGLDVLMWLGRNICGILLVTTAGLLIGQRLSQPRPRERLWDGSTLEFLAACLAGVAVYFVVFVVGSESLLFLVLGVLIWCGVRFSTLMNSLHMLALGYLAIYATFQGSGPFTEQDRITNAVLVQLFVVATASTGLALSTGLDERARLHSELRQNAEEMAYQAQLTDAVVNSMAEGLAVVDDSGRWLLRNAAATKVGGFPGDLRALLAAAAGPEDPLARALAGQTVRDMEIRVADPPAAGRILAVSATPLPRDSVTGRARALLIFRDATIEHARRVDLTAFAQVVAHDLRNPLAAVEGWTEMMAVELGDGTAGPALVRDYVDRVGTGTRRMKALIEDLLGRATHDATLQLRRVDLEAVVKEVAADHSANGHVRVGHIPDAQADPALVRQLFDNLIANALKFVPPGSDPCVQVTGRRTDSGTVAVTVADEGVGLPEGSHERIFEQRQRAHASSYDGRGLGLAICRRIVERHGGSIVARDNDGRGAVFEFTLPAPD
nr:ATP-binding protein [Nocardioides agariphilus]